MFWSAVRRVLSASGAQASASATAAAPNTASFGTAVAIVAGLGVAGSAGAPLKASDDVLAPPSFPWSHTGYLDTFDHAAIRRGFEVYKNVCSSCHGLERVAFRNLVGVAFNEEEAKEIAADYQIQDGPNDEGLMYDRPGKLSDKIPSPYANDVMARAANGGALPPDLSLIVKARGAGADYIFSLLTGYCDPPEGVTIREGLHYNPYFPGGSIAMGQQLFDEGVEYSDGTPATMSQQAKDVSIFLAWAAEPEHDDRKKMGFKAISMLVLVTAAAWYWKRAKWSVVKSRTMHVLNN